jgi:hypothetical protein
MIRTLVAILASSLVVASFAIGSAPMAGAAAAGGLHRGGPAVVAPVLKRNFGAFRGARRPGAFRGFPWVGVGSYDTPPADVSVTNNQFVVPPTAYRRVCRTQALVVPAEAGGEREVHVTRCFLE